MINRIKNYLPKKKDRKVENVPVNIPENVGWFQKIEDGIPRPIVGFLDLLAEWRYLVPALICLNDLAVIVANFGYFLLAFAIFVQFVADRTRDIWEKGKMPYWVHVARHGLMALSIGLLLFHTMSNPFLFRLLFCMMAFENFLIFRHFCDKEMWKIGALSPGRPQRWKKG